MAGTLSQCPCWAQGLAGVWLVQRGSCPTGAQLLSISHQRRVYRRTGMNFILSSRGSNDETYVEVISLLAQYMQCSKCSVNVCGMNKFKRRKEEKRRQRFTPCHLSMQMPHPSHQHTHIQHGLLKGLIHYVVNSLPSVTLSASSSQYQSSLMPRQQLPPTRQPGVAQMVREHKARGTGRRRRSAGRRLWCQFGGSVESWELGGLHGSSVSIFLPRGTKPAATNVCPCGHLIHTLACSPVSTRDQHGQYGRGGREHSGTLWLPGHTAAGPIKRPQHPSFTGCGLATRVVPKEGKPLQPGQRSETQGRVS